MRGVTSHARDTGYVSSSSRIGRLTVGALDVWWATGH